MPESSPSESNNPVALTLAPLQDPPDGEAVNCTVNPAQTSASFATTVGNAFTVTTATSLLVHSPNV